MSKRHVKQYFVKVQKSYNEMKKQLAGFEKELAEGKVEESQLAYARSMIKPLQDNYDRLAYVMYLLELPKHDSISVYRNKGFKGLFKYLVSKKATSDYIMKENYDVLTELREFINCSEKEKVEESSENG